MAESVGGVYYDVEARTQGLIEGQRQVKRSTGAIQKDFQRTGNEANRLNMNLTRVAKAIGSVFAVRQIQRFVLSTAQAIDEQSKFAQAVSVSFRELQRLQFAAEQNGATANEFNNSLRRLARRTEEAARGTGAAVQAFENLGLNAKELQHLSPDEIFLRVSDAFKELEGSGKEVSTAFGLFDTEGAKLINTMRQGSAGIIELGDEAERTGRVLSDQAAADAARFNDELNKLRGAVRGAAVGMGNELLPALTDVISTFTDFISTGDNVQRIIHTLGVVGQATAVIFAARFVGAMAASAAGMSAAAIAAKTLTGAAAMLGGPVGVITTASLALILIGRNLGEATEKAETHKTAIEEMAAEYKNFNEQQRKEEIRAAQLEVDALKRRRAEIELERELLEIKTQQSQVQQARRGSDAALTRATSASLENASAQERMAEQIDVINDYIEEFETRIGILTGEIVVNTEAQEENARATRESHKQSEEAARVLTNLAQRNEELRAAIDGTTEAMEIRRAIQQAGVELGSAEANVIEQLIRGNRELAEAMLARARAGEQAQAQQARFESIRDDIALQKLRLQLSNDEYEVRAAIMALGEDATPAQQEEIENLIRGMQQLRFEAELLGPTLEQSFRQIGVSALDDFSSAMVDVLSDAKSIEDAMKGIARSILSDLLTAVIRYWVGQAAAAAMGSKATAAAVAPAATASAASWAPAATAASIATFGGAATVGTAAYIGALASGQAVTTAMTMGGGRLFGGPVQPGTIYPITEDGRPEILMQGGKQYLLPGSRGEVISNRDMRQMNDNSQMNLGGVTIYADSGMTQERFNNYLFDAEPLLYELMQSAKDARGER